MTPHSTTAKKNLFTTLAEELLVVLDPRSKDVIKRRYGLNTGKKETLESIGQEYNITRERVRQIESQSKKALSTRLDILKPAMETIESIFKDQGGILKREHITELVQERVDASIMPTLVEFFLELVTPYTYVTTEVEFDPHWNHPQHVVPVAQEVVKAGVLILHKAKHPLPEKDFIQQITEHIKQPVTEKNMYAWLMASRHIRKTPFGEWGLLGWAEVTPRGVGDKAYAVLRRRNKPAHFREIAELINSAHFDRKTANAQTVHNELIKDERFVLVGRGLYGLREWGFIPGTVADVLESVLKKAEQPLSREELIEQVLAQRLVKKNTILLSLQDQSRFVKMGENRYTLRENS